MAVNVEYIIKLRDKFSASVKNANSEADKLNNKVNSINSSFSKLGGVIAGLGITAGLTAIGRNVISTLSEFEKFEAVLTNTLGSNSAAQAALNDIKEFAAKTPFQVDGITGAFVKLANQGFVPTITEMTKLGDIAASTGKDFDQLAEGILDAQTGQFERLKEFGIVSEKQGDKVTFTFKKVKTQVDFTADAIQKYILGLGSAAGVSGAMAAISETTGGKISNLEDSITELWLTIGENLKPQIDAVIGAFASLVETLKNGVIWVSKNSDLILDLTVAIIAILTPYALLTAALKLHAWYTGLSTTAIILNTLVTEGWAAAQVALNIALTANPIGIVIALLAALAAAIAIAWRHSETFRGVILGLWEVMKNWYQNIWTLGKEVLGGLGELLLGVFTFDTDKIKAGLNSLKGAFVHFGEKTAANWRKGFAKGFEAGKDKPRMAVGVMEEDPRSVKNGGLKPTPITPTGVDAGISGIKSEAPKTFNINIEKLVEELNINTTNLKESATRIKEEVQKAILTALTDVSIVSE